MALLPYGRRSEMGKSSRGGQAMIEELGIKKRGPARRRAGPSWRELTKKEK